MMDKLVTGISAIDFTALKSRVKPDTPFTKANVKELRNARWHAIPYKYIL